MVMNRINALLKQAITTFSCKKELFHQNLEVLKAVLNGITSSDIDLQPQFNSASLWNKANKAPVTYIDIFENEKLSLGVFILKPGMKIPLHDHPQMYGLIKVVMGKIKVTSFSLNTEKTKIIDGQLVSHPQKNSPMLLTVEKTFEIDIDSDSECCVLEPEKHNVHEIESVDGPAAFVDILSPPYETEIDEYGPRKCTYFKVLKQVDNLIYKLQEVHSPTWFWNDTFPYTGPRVLQQELHY